MSKANRNTIEVQGTSVGILSQPDGDYISLTDMVRNFDGAGALIEQWLKNKDTVLFLGVWERINNPSFNSLEFEGIKNEAGRNSFFLSARKWIDLTGAKGLIASAGRYGGTYAHKDIAFDFGSWLSPEFKLYLIKEFQRLKDDENDRLKLGWNLQRTLAKINYRIHTDAIKETLLPPAITKAQTALVYASEADLLNVALFGQTAKQWRVSHPGAEGNIRDHAPLEQLVVITNLESLNSVLIRQGLPQPERLLKLNEIAITQMRILLSANTAQRLK
jgi:KilA-N domain